MTNIFFTKSDFNLGLKQEIILAKNVYLTRKINGFEDNSITKFDFNFTSNSQDKLELLGNFLSEVYGYEINSLEKNENIYELSGCSIEFPVDQDNLTYWVLDLYSKGYKFDCKLAGYGSIQDIKNQRFPDISQKLYDKYFELAMVAFDKQNLGISFIYFSIAIKIDPYDPNAWYSRGIVKEELLTSKSAREDYDKAIELAPDFTEAFINRAANKDEAGEYIDAIKDYTKAIELDPKNEIAYFNRGNSKFRINDLNGACKDWNVSKTLGSDYAQDRLNKNCKNISSN